ncbi:MAG: pirin family protein, partial [Chloroflexota bacterium]|nr:pirin family protein [Chloroflexota bacterium]
MSTPTPRTIAQVVTPQVVMEGAGVRLRRSIGGYELDHLDPFLLFDDFSSENPDDFVAGFPWHPHRGIETVTYILAGEVDHRDSIGNAGSIGAGDCQWMTAGGGIMHEEMPRVAPQAAHGRLAGFQLWVNLPTRLKMCAPRYQNIAAAEVPTGEPAPGVHVRVVAGKTMGVAGPVRDIAAEPTYMDVSLEPGATFTQPVPRGQAAFVYLFEGSSVFGRDPAAGAAVRSDGHTISAPRLAVLGDGDTFTASAGRQPVRYLLVSGRPLGEPIARYGPF